jgi:hypothetical protein
MLTKSDYYSTIHMPAVGLDLLISARDNHGVRLACFTLHTGIAEMSMSGCDEVSAAWLHRRLVAHNLFLPNTDFIQGDDHRLISMTTISWKWRVC